MDKTHATIQKFSKMMKITDNVLEVWRVRKDKVYTTYLKFKLVVYTLPLRTLYKYLIGELTHFIYMMKKSIHIGPNAIIRVPHNYAFSQVTKHVTTIGSTLSHFLEI